MKRYLAELREGCRIITTREFWDAFRAYWSPDAVSKRIDKWAASAAKKRAG